MEFALSHTIRFDLLPLDLSKGYHFFVQMNGRGRFASIGCVGAASCSFDSCSVYRAIRRSLPRNHICTKPSERCRIPADILNHPGKASGRCWVVKWRLLSSALLAFLNIFRVMFEPAALYGLLPKIDCDFQILNLYLCLPLALWNWRFWIEYSVLFSTGKGVYIVLKLVTLLPCWVLKEEYIIL